ncbi:hypothetical protein [Trichothermofontia sp.]
MRLQHLPWLALIQMATLAVLLAGILDILFVFLLSEFSLLQTLILPWFNFLPPLTQFFVGVGVGALAVSLFERLQPDRNLTAASLWALCLCLIFCLWLKTLLPLPSFLLGLDYAQILGLLVGISYQGKRYWR